MKKDTINNEKTKDKNKQKEKDPIINSDNQKANEVPKNWSSRKGCYWCKAPLYTFKEKFTRCCVNCAKKTLEGANKMAAGQVKEGFQDITKIVFNQSQQAKQLGEGQMKIALDKRRSKVEKMLRRKGESEEDIQEGLKKFDEAMK